MAEKPEDLNLPAAVITRMIKEVVSLQRHSIQILVFRVKQNNVVSSLCCYSVATQL